MRLHLSGDTPLTLNTKEHPHRGNLDQVKTLTHESEIDIITN